MNRVLLPLILIIIAIASFFFWINPHYTSVKALKAELAESNKALSQVQELESVRAKLTDMENSFKESDLIRLQKLLPDNVDNIRLFLDIQGVAARYDTSIQDISVGDQGKAAASSATTKAIGPSGKQYGQMALSFSVSTNYENLSLFLKDLEKSLRIVEIKSLGFTVNSKNPNRYKVTVAINAFWLNSAAATASIIQK